MIYSIEAMAKTEFDAPDFNGHLFDIQDALDPQNRHDCGGFAGMYFGGMDDEWRESTYLERVTIIRQYIDAQTDWISDEV